MRSQGFTYGSHVSTGSPRFCSYGSIIFYLYFIYFFARIGRTIFFSFIFFFFRRERSYHMEVLKSRRNIKKCRAETSMRSRLTISSLASFLIGHEAFCRSRRPRTSSRKLQRAAAGCGRREHERENLQWEGSFHENRHFIVSAPRQLFPRRKRSTKPSFLLGSKD